MPCLDGSHCPNSCASSGCRSLSARSSRSMSQCTSLSASGESCPPAYGARCQPRCNGSSARQLGKPPLPPWPPGPPPPPPPPPAASSSPAASHSSSAIGIRRGDRLKPLLSIECQPPPMLELDGCSGWRGYDPCPPPPPTPPRRRPRPPSPTPTARGRPPVARGPPVDLHVHNLARERKSLGRRRGNGPLSEPNSRTSRNGTSVWPRTRSTSPGDQALSSTRRSPCAAIRVSTGRVSFSHSWVINGGSERSSPDDSEIEPADSVT